MAINKIFKTLNINGVSYIVKPCWDNLKISKEYMIALLDRDEFAPELPSKPTSAQTIYTDPASGGQAGFHPGQCASYPDQSATDKTGLVIVKNMTYNQQGIPEKMTMFNATDLENRVANLERIINNGCFGNGKWYNTLKWQSGVSWNNGG